MACLSRRNRMRSSCRRVCGVHWLALAHTEHRIFGHYGSSSTKDPILLLLRPFPPRSTVDSIIKDGGYHCKDHYVSMLRRVVVRGG